MVTLIQDQAGLLEAIRYIATETSKLSQTITGATFPISSLTIFAHSEEEFETLTRLQSELGTPFDEQNGPRVQLNESVAIGENRIGYLRIRKPDPERPQVGCNDFDVDYKTFKNEFLSRHPEQLHLIQRPNYEMVELRDERFDVLAYVISN